MKNPYFNITAHSILGIPAIVQFDSQYDNESLYTICGSILQTRDGKENPPRLSTYYIFEGEEYPLCYGFCSVLMNWALLEAYNRYIIANPSSKVVLTSSELNFNFEAYVPVDDLCKLYIERLKILYIPILSCSPRLKYLTESDDALFSRVLFDEYDYLYDFECRGIFNDFSHKQIEDFLIWWKCLEHYIIKHYKISMPVSSVSKRVLQYLCDDGKINIPKGMNFETFCKSSVELTIDKTIKDEKNKYQIIAIMPTHIYHDNAQHIDHSKNIYIDGSNIDMDKLLRDFLKNEVSMTQQIKKEKTAKDSQTIQEVRKRKKPIVNTSFMTFQTNGITKGHVTLLYQKLMDVGWIPKHTPADDFQHLFSGKSCVCKVTWTGGGKGNLRELFRIMREQELITIPGNNGLEAVLESHFVDKNGNYLTGLNSSGNGANKSLPIIKECISLLQLSLDIDD